MLAERGNARPGTVRALASTALAPVVPAVRDMFGHRVHYAVDPYVDHVHTESNGAQVFRSSRPHSLGASSALVGDKATAEFNGAFLKEPNPAASAAGYAAYAERGIRVVVDLREEATAADRERATKAGLEYVNVKLRDNAIFNPIDSLVAAVNAVRAATAQGKSVVLHCEMGIGRTGLVAAAVVAARHPEWTEEDVVKYGEDRGLELIGQKRALQRFFRAMLAGDIVETESGLVVPEGRSVRMLDQYPARPGVSRASAARRMNGEALRAPAQRPYRQTDSRGILDAMAAASAGASASVEPVITEGNRILEWPLVGNAEIGRAARQLIESAEREVFIETMIFRDSHIVQELKAGVQALAKTRPNVPVYIRVSPRMPPFFERHDAYTRAVEKIFDSPNVVVGSFDATREGNALTGVFGLNVSHSKTITVDNRRALVTDANLEGDGDQPVNNAEGRAWFQTAMVIEGPAVAKIREQSANGWQHALPAVGRKLPPPPPAHPGFADGARILTLGQKAGSGRNNAAHQASLAGFQATVDRAAARRAAGQSPGERILIITPNLNDPETVALLARATEHLHVYVMLAKGYMAAEQEMPGQGGGNARNVKRLAEMAKNPSWLHVRWFGAPTENGTPARAAEGRGMDISHAKPSVAGDTVRVTSRNFDTQSATTSRELEIVVESRDAVTRYYRLFRSLWARSPVAFEASSKAAQLGATDLALDP